MYQREEMRLVSSEICIERKQERDRQDMGLAVGWHSCPSSNILPAAHSDTGRGRSPGSRFLEAMGTTHSLLFFLTPVTLQGCKRQSKRPGHREGGYCTN